MSGNRSWHTVRQRNDQRCERLLGKAALLDTADLAWDEVAATELDPDALNCLVYMRDVEGFTDREFAGLSNHPATWNDPMMRSFLTNWRAEEREHAVAIGRFLDCYAVGRGIEIPAPQPPPPAVESTLDRWLLRLTHPVGQIVVAAHMAWGATNELLTLNGYRLLAERAKHPVLSDLLSRIAAQESRHYSFYVLQVEWRLAASWLARGVVRQMLRRTWTPVGVGADFKAPAEFDGVIRYLAAGEAGRRAAQRMDRRLSELPGLDGLGLYAKAVGRPLAVA